MTLRRAAARLLALARRQNLDRELDLEIQAHLELAQQDALARGLPPEEARRAARRHFGGIEQMKEEHRDRRSFRWIEMLLADLRHGLASLIRAPGFTAVVVCVLALGIGANVAVFSIVNAVLLKPVPFPEPQNIVRVWEAPRARIFNATSTPDFLDWQRLGADTFEAWAAEQPVSAAVTGTGDPMRWPGMAVTAGYFQVFAAGTSLGRTFQPGDDQPGAPPVVVLSHAAWQDYFAGDPEILQRRLILDGEPHQIVGILRPGAFDRDKPQFWKPLVLRPAEQSRDFHWLSVYARLRDGVTLARASERMNAIHAALADVSPMENRGWKIVVESLDRWLVGDNLRLSISVVFGAVVLVLLIACANVANLLLAKGAARRKELAVRAALGARRGRLVAQLLTESLVLCLLGGVAGAALSRLLIAACKPLFRQALPFTADLSLDLRVLAFAAAVTLGVTLLAGTLPAMQTSFGNLTECLNRAARGSSGHGRVRRTIVVGEVALSLILVSGALLLLRSLLNLQQLDTGVRTENVITMSLDLPPAAYPTPQKAAQFYAAAAARIQAAPGVTAAAFATQLPLEWIRNGEGIRPPGLEKFLNVRFKRVDPDYFNALGIPVLAGRGITARDQDGAPRVAVINQALAARLSEAAGIRDPVGRTVRQTFPFYGAKGVSMADVEIVGIIRSERVNSPGFPDPPVVYVPLAQFPDTRVKLLVRAALAPASVMSGIRVALGAVDPNLALGDLSTLEQFRGRTLSGISQPTWLIGVFAAVAILLAAIGLYGVLSHLVAQQRREIGIRMALGARSRDVLAHVLRTAMSLVAAGLALGALGAFALTRVLKSLLFHVSPLDPLALAAACLTMTLIGVLAGFLPARRAARLDPVTTLREEG